VVSVGVECGIELNHRLVSVVDVCQSECCRTVGDESSPSWTPEVCCRWVPRQL
jgi:hypothetical protein